MENRRPPQNKTARPNKFNNQRSERPDYRSVATYTGDARDSRTRPPSRGSVAAKLQREGSTGKKRTGFGLSIESGRASEFSRSRTAFQPKVRIAARRGTRSSNEVRITSDLQITDGKLRGRMLQNSISPKATPTARKIRETMFRTIFRRVRAGRFLDLCSGPGTLGFEAISRGAMLATFVERSARMCSIIRKNIEELNVKPGHGEIFEMEALPFLRRSAKRGRRWDVVYLDHTNGCGQDDLLRYLSRGSIVEPGGVVLIEHRSDLLIEEKLGNLKRWRAFCSDETTLSFYNRK